MSDTPNQFEYRGFNVELELTRAESYCEVIQVTATKHDHPHEGTKLQTRAFPSVLSMLTFGFVSPDIESMAARATDMIQSMIDRWHTETDRKTKAIERGITEARKESGPRRTA